jgi:hypothetical protein
MPFYRSHLHQEPAACNVRPGHVWGVAAHPTRSKTTVGPGTTPPPPQAANITYLQKGSSQSPHSTAASWSSHSQHMVRTLSEEEAISLWGPDMSSLLYKFKTRFEKKKTTTVTRPLLIHKPWRPDYGQLRAIDASDDPSVSSHDRVNNNTLPR